MQSADDNSLLKQYAENHSDAAFAALVKTHINLVYSVALRCAGNPNHAEEITQAVFIILAQKAPRLRHERALSSWLFQTTRLTASNLLRAEIRRQRREQEAYMQSGLNEPADPSWPPIAPVLDAAVASLREKDRRAILLRFYEGRSLREISAAFGTTEAAAEKRVGRAVEKLRVFFGKRGIAVSAVALTAAVSAHSVQAAPAALAKSVTAVAAAKGATASVSTLTLIKGTIKAMAWTKSQSAVAAGIIALGVGAPFFLQHQAHAKLAAFDDLLHQQAAKISSRQAEHDRLSGLAASASLPQKQLADLQRLRAEMASLQPAAADAVNLSAENSRLQRDITPKGPLQLKEEIIARVSHNKNLLIAFYQYSQQHNGQFPTNFNDAVPFLSAEAKNQTKVSSEQFEIVFSGSPTSVTNPADIIALREKDAWSTVNTSNPQVKWAKIYGFVDGHVIVHQEPENNFADFENAHIASPPSTP